MNEREIATFTGGVFDFYKPSPKSICIEDIAHALACTNRYGGHTRVPYSVAEHSVRMSYMTVGNPMINLMHDTAEAYIGDIPKPQKAGLNWSSNYGFGVEGFGVSYMQVEAEIMRQIGTALNIPDLACWLAMPRDTKKADVIMLATEVRDLMPPQVGELFGLWFKDVEPLPTTIIPWTWQFAEQEFLRRYKELKHGKS